LPVLKRGTKICIEFQWGNPLTNASLEDDEDDDDDNNEGDFKINVIGIRYEDAK
jgi:hypothetical protein